MFFLPLIALLLSNPNEATVLKKTAELSSQTHNICLSLLPIKIAESDSWNSLVCGQKLSDQNLQQLLSESSLIHIFIVSGSHLLLLDAIFTFLRFPFCIRFSFLLLYSLATLFQPPCVRSLVAILFQYLLKKLDSHLSANMKSLWAGFLTLSLLPTWVHSRSLLMSWVAALVVGQKYSQNSFLDMVLKCILTYLLMIPMLWGFASLHPVGILMNLLLAPIIALFLFPLGILCLLFHWLCPFFDFLIGFLKLTLHPVSELTKASEVHTLPLALLWAYTLALQFILHLSSVVRLRSRP